MIFITTAKKEQIFLKTVTLWKQLLKSQDVQMNVHRKKPLLFTWKFHSKLGVQLISSAQNNLEKNVISLESSFLRQTCEVHKS